MARTQDSILVIDMQPTCWEGAPPEGESEEIVAIGMASLGRESLEHIDRNRILIKPRTSTASPYFTENTGLTQEELETGLTFKQACTQLVKRHHSGTRIWATYGEGNRRLFERQCADAGVPFPFGPTHLNVQKLFALMHGMPRELNLAEALEVIDRPLEGNLNHPEDDAWNTASVLSIVLRLRRSEDQNDL